MDDAPGAGFGENNGYWDPANFLKRRSVEQTRYFQEAELKHGRVAMLAAVGSYAKFYWDGPKRHDFMSRVFCVPDQNNMPDISVATRADSKTLAEDQVLRSKGSQMPSCPGGPAG